MLTIPPEKLAYIIEKARELDAQVPVDPDTASGPASEADYLLGTPLLGDYLEEGASALGLSLDDFGRE